MKMNEALDIINSVEGYMVSFEKRVDGLLKSDHFPDKHAGEKLIQTEDEAWELAKQFAVATIHGKLPYINIYVIGKNFVPVKGYEEKILLPYQRG